MSEFGKRAENRLIGAVVASIMLMSVFGSIGIAFSDEVPDEIPDQGEFWSLTIHMIFAGSDAETVEWDFGDGSPASNEWNPSHTYAEPGDYIVKQTVWNSFEGGSTSVAYYLLHVMGDPYVQIVQPEGAPELENIYSPIRTAPEQPDNPIWEGREFIGWFADSEFTVPFDWSIELMSPVIAYAGYSGFVPIYHTVTIKDSDGLVVGAISVQDGASPVVPISPEGKIFTYYVDANLSEEFDWTAAITDDITIYRILEDSVTEDSEELTNKITSTEIVLAGIGTLILIVGLATRRPAVLVISMILLGVVTIGILNIVEIPNVFEYFKGVDL